MALQIAGALRQTLSANEKERIEQKPTENIEAYDNYLQGRRYYLLSDERRDQLIAMKFYQKSIQIDPNFAEGYAGLAIVYINMYFQGYGRSPERLALAKEAIDKALSLKPDEPEVREANGYYYYQGLRDYARALEEYFFCLQKEPGNAFFNANIAWVQRRQGKFEEAIKNFKIALELDPRANHLARELGGTYLGLRRYKEAEPYIDRAIFLEPEIYNNYDKKARLKLFETGDTEIAGQILEKAGAYADRADHLYVERLIQFDIFDRNYQNALERLDNFQEDVLDMQLDYIPKDALRGLIYTLMGRVDQARSHFIRAKDLLEKKVAERPDDARMHAELGKVYAYLGLKEKALQAGLRATELLPVTKDAWAGNQYIMNLAKIYVIIGNFEMAIDKLEYLLRMPVAGMGYFSMHIGELKVNPEWDPLRQYQRFQDLLKDDT